MSEDSKVIILLAKYVGKTMEKALKKRKCPKSNGFKKEFLERFRENLNAQDYGENNYRLKSYVNIFLGITCYQMATERGYDYLEAVSIYDEVCHGMRVLSRKLYNFVDRFPGGYEKVKSSLLEDLKGPSANCWETEVVRDDGEEFAYKITKCLYVDTCERYGCRDFASVFCNHDNWAFGGLHRQVKFVRHSTLVDGECCYDRFLKVKERNG